GAYEVTQGEYEDVVKKNPSSFNQVGGMDTGRFPVEHVSWFEAVDFCNKLSGLEGERRWGRSYRLPTEAEWEYACRGGTTQKTPFHFGHSLLAQQANFKETNLGRPTPVGSYPANGFGLHDMHGNVREWCLDWYDKDAYKTGHNQDPRGPERGFGRVLRGGSY